MNTAKKKLPVLSVVFYVLAAILVLYAVWALVNCHEYIVKLIAGGQLIASGNEFTIASYYMTNCVQYLLYSTAFFFFGRLYSSIPNKDPQSIQELPDDTDNGPSTIFEPDEDADTVNAKDFSDWKSPQ